MLHSIKKPWLDWVNIVIVSVECFFDVFLYFCCFFCFVLFFCFFFALPQKRLPFLVFVFFDLYVSVVNYCVKRNDQKNWRYSYFSYIGSASMQRQTFWYSKRCDKKSPSRLLLFSFTMQEHGHSFMLEWGNKSTIAGKIIKTFF